MCFLTKNHAFNPITHFFLTCGLERVLGTCVKYQLILVPFVIAIGHGSFGTTLMTVTDGLRCDRWVITLPINHYLRANFL